MFQALICKFKTSKLFMTLKKYRDPTTKGKEKNSHSWNSVIMNIMGANIVRYNREEP
jgi:hypothetical protein